MADIKDRIRKVYALALEGVDGESEAAQALLERELKEGEKGTELSPDELKKINMLMKGLSEKKPQKAITDGKNGK